MVIGALQLLFGHVAILVKQRDYRERPHFDLGDGNGMMRMESLDGLGLKMILLPAATRC